MDSEVSALFVDVIQGNPGACVIVQHILTLPTWPQLLCHCKAQGLVGHTLWRVVKDEYRHDWRRFVADQVAQMAPERARVLTQRGQSVQSHYN